MKIKTVALAPFTTPCYLMENIIEGTSVQRPATEINDCIFQTKFGKISQVRQQGERSCRHCHRITPGLSQRETLSPGAGKGPPILHGGPGIPGSEQGGETVNNHALGHLSTMSTDRGQVLPVYLAGRLARSAGAGKGNQS